MQELIVHAIQARHQAPVGHDALASSTSKNAANVYQTVNRAASENRDGAARLRPACL